MRITDFDLAKKLGVLDTKKAETPQQTYERTSRRMENLGSAQEKERSKKEWPTLGGAYRAMGLAFEQMTAPEKAADLASAEADLKFAANFI